MNEIIHTIVLCCLALFIAAAIFGVQIHMFEPATMHLEGFN